MPTGRSRDQGWGGRMVDVKSRKVIVSTRSSRKVRLAFRWAVIEALNGAYVV